MIQHFPLYYLVLGSMTSLFFFMLISVTPIFITIGYFFGHKLDKVYRIYKIILAIRTLLLIAILTGWMIYGNR